MESTFFKAPDLDNGFLVLGASSDNAWTTEILCAVAEKTTDDERWHYLSKECRSEDVPLINGGNPSSIFQVGKSLEFVMAIFDGRAVQLTNSDISVRPIKEESTERDETSPLLANAMHDSFTAEAHCRQRNARIVEVAEALERLRNRTLFVRNLFMRISWAGKTVAYELFCPCRYVNFGTSADDANDYIQPISGYVMAPHPEVGLQIGYVACALAVDGRRTLEFCGKGYRNVFSWAAEKIDAEGGNSGPVRNLANSFPISTTVFETVMPIDGKCDLFEFDRPLQSGDSFAG